MLRLSQGGADARTPTRPGSRSDGLAPLLLEPDEGSAALERFRMVACSGTNLLRLYRSAITHPVEAAAVDLRGQLDRPHLVLWRCPENLSHCTMRAKARRLPRWRLLRRRSQ